MRVMVTGGAGFIGSHLCERLLRDGNEAVCVDNLLTGNENNVARLRSLPGFTFIRADVSEPFSVDGSIDAVLHFASPASPVDYMRFPMETLLVGSAGTRNALEVALAHNARFLLASTSEVYGDPQIHPQTEDYWGNVNPIGPRSVYDEAKRFAEATTSAYRRTHGLDAKIIRIFNTYGPRMQLNDGRVVPNFIPQALRNEPITVFGDGSQTRSFCYVDDLVDGILLMVNFNLSGPVNLGNPREMSILDFAKIIIDATGSSSKIVYRPLPADDPKIRRPDITLARESLGWEPGISLEQGLIPTIEYFKNRI